MGIRNGAKGEHHSHNSFPLPPPGCGAQPPLPKALPGGRLSSLPLLDPTALNHFPHMHHDSDSSRLLSVPFIGKSLASTQIQQFSSSVLCLLVVVPSSVGMNLVP